MSAPSERIRSRYVPSTALGGVSSERIRAAFDTLADAWLDIGGIPPRSALYAVLAVAGVESGYGAVSTNNWGSIQCGHGPPCGNDCVPLGDTHADGEGYTWCYRRYGTPREGALSLAQLLVKRIGLETLSSGEPRHTAAAMKRAGYYELEESKYADALSARYRDVLTAMGVSPAAPSADVGPKSGSGWALLVIGAVGAALLWRRS